TPLRGDELRQETLTFTEHSYEIRGVAFSPDGLRIASAGSDGRVSTGRDVRVWDAQTGRVSAEVSDQVDASGRMHSVHCLAWHPEGHRIASAGLTVKVWDARTGQPVFNLLAAPEKNALPCFAVAFSPDGRYLVTGNRIGAVHIWDGETGQYI